MEGETISVEENSRAPIEYTTTESLIKTMVRDPQLLKDGFKTFSKYEKHQNFYINLLLVLFNTNLSDKDKKLAASTLKIFLRRNWSDNNYITDNERLVSFILTSESRTNLNEQYQLPGLFFEELHIEISWYDSGQRIPALL